MPTDQRRYQARATPLIGLVTLALAIISCQAPDAAPPQTSAPTPAPASVVVDAPLTHFIRQRLEAITQTRLPTALEAGELGEARYLCALGDATIAQAEALEVPEVNASVAALRERCGVDVAGRVLDEQLTALNGADESQRAMRCNQSGAGAIVFLTEHPSADPSIAERREQIFALCPELAEHWRAYEQQRQQHRAP